MSALVRCEACGKEVSASSVGNPILISELTRYRKALWEVKNDLLHLPNPSTQLAFIAAKIDEALRG